MGPQRKPARFLPFLEQQKGFVYIDFAIVGIVRKVFQAHDPERRLSPSDRLRRCDSHVAHCLNHADHVGYEVHNCEHNHNDESPAYGIAAFVASSPLLNDLF